jgi:hypothetical protein
MRNTRGQYHKAMRDVRSREMDLRKEELTELMLTGNNRKFGCEIHT